MRVKGELDSILCSAVAPFHALTDLVSVCLSSRAFELLWENVFLLLRTFWGLRAREYGRASAARDEVQLLRDLTHSNTSHGCVYKHPADTQTRGGVSEHGNHQEEPARHVAERAGGGTSELVFSVISSRGAAHGWSTGECYRVLDSQEANSRCVDQPARTFSSVRTSLTTPQMPTKHDHWTSNPNLHLNSSYFPVELGVRVKVNTFVCLSF